MALSETGLNDLLHWLCSHGLASGTAQLVNGPTPWRWEQVTMAFTDDEAIHLTGRLLRNQTTVMVDTTVPCSLTSAAQLSVRSE